MPGHVAEGERKLVDAMMRLVQAEGPEVPVDRICSEAGCSRGGFYHYFPSKRALLLRAISEIREQEGIRPEVLVRLLPLARLDPEVARLLAPASPDRSQRVAQAAALGEQIAATVRG